MILGRRARKPFANRLRDLLWPRAGLRRGVKYLVYRVVRLPGTPYSIAAGVAAGAAVSFTPLIGLHFVLGALLALVTGGNVLAALLGTAVGNPWTFPFIWALIYKLGHGILGMDAGTGVPQSFSFGILIEQPWEVLYPMIVGALPTAVLAWMLVFAPCYAGVSRYQALREARRTRARRRRLARGRWRTEQSELLKVKGGER